MSTSFKAKVKCENCGFIGEAEFPRHTIIANASCPNCGLTYYLKLYDPWKF